VLGVLGEVLIDHVQGTLEDVIQDVHDLVVHLVLYLVSILRYIVGRNVFEEMALLKSISNGEVRQATYA
jgi:hypothetical protein